MRTLILRVNFYNVFSYITFILFFLYPFICYFENYYFNIIPFNLLVLINLILLLTSNGFRIKLFFEDHKSLSIIVLVFFCSRMIMPLINMEIDLAGHFGKYIGNNVIPLLLYISMLNSRPEVLYNFLKSKLLNIFMLVCFVALSLSFKFVQMNLLNESGIERIGGGLVLRLSDLYAIYFGITLFSRKFKPLYLFTSLLVLFMFRAFSSFFIFLIATIVAYIVYQLKARNIPLRTLFSTLMLMIIASFMIPRIGNNIYAGIFLDRIKDIRSGLDSSLLGRQYFNELGVSIIRAKPITGEYLYHYRLYGYRFSNYGGYMHNVFSFWAEYGLSVFILILLIYLNIVIEVPKAEFGMAFLFIYSLGMAFFRSSEWYYYPFCLYMFVQSASSRKNSLNSNR